MLTILLGNAIVLVPDDPQRACRHEVRRLVSRPLPRELRRAVARTCRPLLRALVACGWFGIQTWIGGAGIEHAGRRRVAGMEQRRRGHLDLVCRVLAGAGLDHPQRARGHQDGSKAGRRRCCSAGGAVLLLWAMRAGGGLGQRARRVDAPASGRRRRSGSCFPSALTANVGYWATLSLNIPDFTRYARSQRSQALGQALGLPATMTAFAFIGVAVTSATIVVFGEAIWDPVVLIARIGNAAGHHLRRARRPARATDDEHGGQRGVTGERLLEPRAAPHQLRDRRPDYRGDRHRDDAVETLRRRRGLHLHLARSATRA